jgi:SSS family solute:Na+ symporter
MTSYLSDKAVTLDGVINLEEWSDATVFSSVDKGENMWLCEFYAPKDPEDLSLVAGYVKHTHDALYFAFNVTDNLNYGVDTPRWKPKGNPNSDLLNASGWPFFGDEMEILINAEGAANPSGGDVAGNETSWQLVANTVAARCRHSGATDPHTDAPLSRCFPAVLHRVLQGKSTLGGLGVGGLLPGDRPSSAYARYLGWIADKRTAAVTRLHPGGKG